MKRLRIFLLVSLCAFTAACRYHHNTDIQYHESGDYYSMRAYFPESETRKVDEYMDDKIGRASNMSFVNSRIDGTISLDDHTSFYIKKYPGTLEIKLDKHANTIEAYQQVKSMCEGIKRILAGGND